MRDKKEILLGVLSKYNQKYEVEKLEKGEYASILDIIYEAMEEYKNECLPKEPIPCENKTEEI